MFTLLIVIVYLDFLTIHHSLAHPLRILSSHTHSYIYLSFLRHTSFHIPSFPNTLILSYNFLSSQIQPFYIYPYLLPNSSFHIPIISFPPTLILLLYLPFLPHSSLNTPYFPPTLILSYKSIIFPSSHNHQTFPNLILFLYSYTHPTLDKPIYFSSPFS